MALAGWGGARGGRGVGGRGGVSEGVCIGVFVRARGHEGWGETEGASGSACACARADTERGAGCTGRRPLRRIRWAQKFKSISICGLVSVKPVFGGRRRRA